jgi:hypothetical protein
MNGFGARIAAVALALLVIAALVALYIANYLAGPPTVAATEHSPGIYEVVLKTEAAVGPQGANAPWVSYLVRNDRGEWVHTTEFQVPAHATVHFTVYQFDGDSGLRNPFLSQVQGTVGRSMVVDGKTMDSIPPEEASHTFAIPQLGIIVPLRGVPEEAENQCEEGPCSLSQAHETVEFIVHTGDPGRFRWQCFVPCAAGFIAGFGGPMQTIGYMDGFLRVV